MLDVVLNHDQILYGSTGCSTICLTKEVKNIEILINIINDAPDLNNREEIDVMLDKKLNISDQINTYTKLEDDVLLLLKADKTELIDEYNKTEIDELLAFKLNITDQIDINNKIEVDTILGDKLNIADQIDAYTKYEDDALLLLKADKTELIDAYSRIEDDALLDDKLNISDQTDAYNKTEVDALLDDKLNITDQIDAYNKQEDNDLLLLKADKTELDTYVDLTSTQMTTDQKQLRMFNASKISKLNKNENFILFADGDILISSLVLKSQLEKVRDITQGKSKGYVFVTTNEINTWIEDQKNVAKFAIGDNLYIVDKQVMDYLWDGTDHRALVTKLPETSNVIIFLGTATGGGNITTDLSFSGNTFIPAKNRSFIINNNDETITSQITFKTTIHSVGIIVQNYYNNSVVCAGGGVKAIKDININVDLSNYYNKSQTYSQTETDQKLNLKLNISNQIDAYTKTQDDALLLLKADKTQLIDSYTKGDADNLLNNKAKQSTTCTKTETDQLISQIEVGDVNLSGYLTLDPVTNTYLTMFEVDAKLSSKMDSSILGNLRSTIQDLTVNGSKIFTSNVNATGFVKTGKDDTSVILADGGYRLLSSFGGIEDLTSSAFSNMNDAVISYSLIRIRNLYIFILLANGGNYNVGTFNTDYLDQDNIAIITYVPFPNNTVDKGGYVSITHSTGLITLKSTTNTYIQCASATWFKQKS
ncbi:MAG: hypothetical protein EZS28_014748 [Streblomastix strix]|uniref:Uncharacterized protein n=1 Tax=Streblomastix strix TaxID=222440 RepID=A0A5J4W503_9EUKA|nr:MAG: hypothetical protein EZS28_014748 [Streblomastix strix]